MSVPTSPSLPRRLRCSRLPRFSVRRSAAAWLMLPNLALPKALSWFRMLASTARRVFQTVTSCFRLIFMMGTFPSPASSFRFSIRSGSITQLSSPAFSAWIVS